MKGEMNTCSYGGVNRETAFADDEVHLATNFEGRVVGWQDT